MTTKGTEYALEVVDGVIPAPRYVVKQCEEILRVINGERKEYFFDYEQCELINNLTKIMIMPKGAKKGLSLYECNDGYQWLTLEALFCIYYTDDQTKLRFEEAILELARKNYKTFTVAEIIIMKMLLEDNFSEFYSVAPKRDLSKLVRDAIEMIIASSPILREYDGTERFQVLRDCIRFTPRKSTYTPLALDVNKMDGKNPTAYVADEVGALPTNYAIEAMKSGQIGVKNPLGMIISTKYPTGFNPLEDEIARAKRTLDGIVEDEKLFALLYEPDEPDTWLVNDDVLLHANPVAVNNEAVFDFVKEQREKAIETPSKRENFLTKHCNIIYSGANGESYVDTDELKACKSEEPIDWSGREVWVGVDFAMSNDNCGIAIVSEEDGKILAKAWAFIPADKIDEKSKAEKVDYTQYIQEGSCIPCGDRVVDYSVMEDFVLGLEDSLGVRVRAIGFDRFNCLSSAQKWDEFYPTIQVKQHSSVLHSPTKLLSEQIESGVFRYDANELLEINFVNARCVYDTNMNRYVHKKKSNGKIDMVMAILDGLWVLERDVLLNPGNSFVAQVF